MPRERAKPTDLPTIEALLATFAYHVECIMTDVPNMPDRDVVRFGLGIGYGPGCPTVYVQVEITPCATVDDPWGVWAHVSIDGQSCGNRCGGRAEYARRCAPIFAWLGKHAGEVSHAA
jgi:hypothetical protein